VPSVPIELSFYIWYFKASASAMGLWLQRLGDASSNSFKLRTNLTC
jgi:hypothetical protein